MKIVEITYFRRMGISLKICLIYFHLGNKTGKLILA